MNIISEIVFSDNDSPESGKLVWNCGTSFTIFDKDGQEIYWFNVYSVNGANITMARAKGVAYDHFTKIQENLERIEENG